MELINGPWTQTLLGKLTPTDHHQRRRERGRLAQSAFRKRQAQAQQEKETKNDELKKAVADILAEVCATDRPELQAKIRHAARIAGLQIEVDNQAASTGSGDQKQIEARLDHSTSSDDVVFLGSGRNHKTHVTNSRPTRHGLSDHSSVSSRRSRSNSHSEAHIRPDPFQCSPCAEGAAIMPFLGAGAFTFAGRIFWHLIEKHEELLKKQKLLLQSNGLTSEPVYTSDATSRRAAFIDLLSVAGTVRDVDPSSWVGMIEKRLGVYHKEWSCHTISRGEVHRVLQPPMVGSSRDLNACQMLSPFTAAQRVRSVVGDDVFAVLAQPVVDRFERKRDAHRAEDSGELVDGFLDMLAETFMCDGFGPLWDVRQFDESLRSWLSSVTGGLVQPARAGQ